MPIRALLALAALAALALSQQPRQTAVSIWQMRTNPIIWDFAPQDARMACVAGEWAVDAQYRFYVCVPDKRYPASGHSTYLWIRLAPDPSFVPPEYAAEAAETSGAIVGALRPLNVLRKDFRWTPHP